MSLFLADSAILANRLHVAISIAVAALDISSLTVLGPVARSVALPALDYRAVLLHVTLLMADVAGGALSFAVLCALTVETPLDLWFAAVIVGVADLLAVPPGTVLAILNSIKRNGKAGVNLPDHRLDCLHLGIASMAEARMNSELKVRNKSLQKKRKSEWERRSIQHTFVVLVIYAPRLMYFKNTKEKEGE